jgi:hypothetical protein
MRSLGVITLLSVVATAAAPGMQPAQGSPLTTTKSARAFVTCFAKDQDRRLASWWFVPKSRGGTFSNLGASRGGKAYFLMISDRKERREITIDNAAPGSAPLEGVNQCL